MPLDFWYINKTSKWQWQCLCVYIPRLWRSWTSVLRIGTGFSSQQSAPLCCNPPQLNTVQCTFNQWNVPLFLIFLSKQSLRGIGSVMSYKKSPEKLRRYVLTKENLFEPYLSINQHQSASVCIRFSLGWLKNLKSNCIYYNTPHHHNIRTSVVANT